MGKFKLHLSIKQFVTGYPYKLNPQNFILSFRSGRTLDPKRDKLSRGMGLKNPMPLPRYS